MAAPPHNLLMHLLLRQLVTGSIAEDGGCDGIAPIPIGLSELHVGSTRAVVILHPLHHEVHLTPRRYERRRRRSSRQPSKSHHSLSNQSRRRNQIEYMRGPP